MNIIKREEYLAEVINCDWCQKNTERRHIKHWVTGARLCPTCHTYAKDKHDEFIEGFKKEMYHGKFKNFEM